MAIIDLLNAYKLQVTTDVSQETQPDSIDPDKVGDIGTDLADILIGYLPAQNRFKVDAGTTFPVGGGDTDLYYQSLANSIQVIRNILGTWTVLATIPIGFSLPDGIVVGLRTSILANVVTVTSGAWFINNVKYSKVTQTQFTLAAKDASFNRYDLIYADTNNDVLIITGTPTLVPVKPAIPANCIEVDYAYIPAVGEPYLLTSPPNQAIVPDPIPAIASDQVAGIFTLNWDATKIQQYGTYGRFAIEMNNTYQQVPISIVKNGSGKPTAYQFDLSGINSLIHIL